MLGKNDLEIACWLRREAERREHNAISEDIRQEFTKPLLKRLEGARPTNASPMETHLFYQADQGHFFASYLRVGEAVEGRSAVSLLLNVGEESLYLQGTTRLESNHCAFDGWSADDLQTAQWQVDAPYFMDALAEHLSDHLNEFYTVGSSLPRTLADNLEVALSQAANCQEPHKVVGRHVLSADDDKGPSLS